MLTVVVEDYIRKLLDLEIKRSLRHRYPVGLIMIDIDDFKRYNEVHGQSAGDALLQELAQVIRKSVREVDLVARYGEDTFAVVFPYADGQGALHSAQRIELAIREHDFSQNIAVGQGKITVSMGVAWYPGDAFQARKLIQTAHQRLLAAKQKGKNQIST